MSLGRQAIRAVIWTTLDKWLSRLIGVAVFAVLARYLTPADFGLVALATAFTGFSEIVASQGMGFAIVMRSEVDEDDYNASFWANAVFGLGVAIVLLVAAWILGNLFGKPELAIVLAGMTVAFFLNCFDRIHVAILTRQLQFKSLAVRNMLASIAGGIIGVILALRGAGAMSIVGQCIVNGLVDVVAVWFACKWRPRFKFSWPHFRRVYSFGWKVALDRIVVYLRDNIDVLLVGYVVGLGTLGVYSVAKRVVDLFMQLFSSVLSAVVYPLFAQAQHHPSRLVNGFNRAVQMTALVLVPLFIGLSVMAEEAVQILVGASWAEAVPLVRILAVACAVSWIDPFIGAVLLARQKPGTVLAVHCFGTLTSAIAVVVGSGWGILGVSVAVTFRRLVGSALLLRFSERSIPGMSMWRSLQQFAAPLVGASVMAVVVWLARGALPSVVSGCAIGVASGVASYVVVVLLLDRMFGVQVLRSVGQLLWGMRGSRPSGLSTDTSLPCNSTAG